MPPFSPTTTHVHGFLKTLGRVPSTSYMSTVSLLSDLFLPSEVCELLIVRPVHRLETMLGTGRHKTNILDSMIEMRQEFGKHNIPRPFRRRVAATSAFPLT
jgi:hypothetical protein